MLPNNALDTPANENAYYLSNNNKKHAYKCQTHSCIGSSLRLISSFYECLLPAVQEVINERNHNRPQLAPNAMFSGSSDALRRSTASLYSPRDDPHIEKYLFKR
jgi:hypothetical protein